MKKRMINLFLASVMLVAMAGLMTACSADDNPVVPTQAEDEEDDDDGSAEYEAPVAADGLAAFMENIIVRDSLGEFVCYGYGKALDEADPSVLSVGVESVDEADEIFRSFIADTTHYVSVGTGNITYMPHDSLGNKQGEIYLTAGGDGCIARITFSDDTPIDRDLVSEVRFIDKKLWPENDEPQFKVGHLYAAAKWYRSNDVIRVYVDITDAGIEDQGLDDHFTSIRTPAIKFLCINDDSYGYLPTLFWASRQRYAYDWEKRKVYDDKLCWFGIWFNDNTNLNTDDELSGNYYKNETRRTTKEWKKAPRDADWTHNCYIGNLKYLSNCLNKNWDMFVKAYGSDRLGDTWYWSRDMVKSDLIIFRLWAYNFKEGKKKSFRAYTNYCHLSGMVTPLRNYPADMYYVYNYSIVKYNDIRFEGDYYLSRQNYYYLSRQD